MNLRIVFLLIFLPLFVSCDEEEQIEPILFSYNTSELPSYVEYEINGTDLSISTTGDKQTLTINLDGDYESFIVLQDAPNWLKIKAVNNIQLTLSEFPDNESDLRSAAVTFTVFKGIEQEKGRIIIHQWGNPQKN